MFGDCCCVLAHQRESLFGRGAGALPTVAHDRHSGVHRLPRPHARPPARCGCMEMDCRTLVAHGSQRRSAGRRAALLLRAAAAGRAVGGSASSAELPFLPAFAPCLREPMASQRTLDAAWRRWPSWRPCQRALFLRLRQPVRRRSAWHQPRGDSGRGACGLLHDGVFVRLR